MITKLPIFLSPTHHLVPWQNMQKDIMDST